MNENKRPCCNALNKALKLTLAGFETHCQGKICPADEASAQYIDMICKIAAEIRMQLMYP